MRRTVLFPSSLTWIPRGKVSVRSGAMLVGTEQRLCLLMGEPLAGGRHQRCQHPQTAGVHFSPGVGRRTRAWSAREPPKAARGAKGANLADGVPAPHRWGEERGDFSVWTVPPDSIRRTSVALAGDTVRRSARSSEIPCRILEDSCQVVGDEPSFALK